MGEVQQVIKNLSEICNHQYKIIEMKNLQISDMEEENRVIQEKINILKDEISAKDATISDLHKWCGHLQGIIDEKEAKEEERRKLYQNLEKRFGILYRIARKIKRKVLE